MQVRLEFLKCGHVDVYVAARNALNIDGALFGASIFSKGIQYYRQQTVDIGN